jgi:hypothetical protein
MRPLTRATATILAVCAATALLALPQAAPSASPSPWDEAALHTLPLYEPGPHGIPLPDARPSCTGIATQPTPGSPGLILTAAHCGQAFARLRPGEPPSPTAIIAAQFIDGFLAPSQPQAPAWDIEVLFAGFPAELGDLPWRTTPLEPGETLVALGYGCGALRAWTGTVAGTDPDTGWIAARSRTPICAPGMSGAGAWDARGRLSGIVVAMQSSSSRQTRRRMDGLPGGADQRDYDPRASIADELLIEPAPVVLSALRHLTVLPDDPHTAKSGDETP